MTAAVETDIDRFIRDQKSKLAHERKALAGDGSRRERSQSPDSKRRVWDKSALGDHRLAEQTNSRTHAGTVRTGLPVGESHDEALRRQMAAERNREYNEMVQKKAVPNRRPPRTPDNMAPRPAPATDRPDPRGRGAVRQSQNDPPPQLHSESGEFEPWTGILPFDNERQHIQHRERLRKERQQDFRDYMTKKYMSTRHKSVTPAEAMGLPVGQYEEAKRKLHREITEQYRAMLEQQQEVSEKLHLLQMSQDGEIDLPYIEESLVFQEHPQTPQPDLNVIGQPPSGAQTQREVNDQFRTRYQEMTSYDPILERLSRQEFDRIHHNQWQVLEKRRKERQLESSLEDIHKREETLRRSLDEEQIREADQEQVLREERRHRQAADRAPYKELEHRPAYFKQGDYERFRERLGEERREEYNEMISKKVEEKPRYYKAREEERNPEQTDRARHAQYPVDGRQDRVNRKPAPSNRRIWREPSGDENIGLPIGEYEKKKQELAAQRKREMQENMSKNQPSSRRQWQDSDHTGLKLSTDNTAARFNEEKRRDYNETISKKTGESPRRLWRESSSEAGLNLGQYEEKRKALVAERQRETERVMAEKNGETPRRTWREPSSEDGLNLGQYEQKRKALIEERQRETERVMAEKTEETPRRTWREPSSEDGLNLGQYEQKRKAFIEERQRDTEKVMAEKTGETPRRTWREPSSEDGLNLGQYEQKRKAYVAERQRDTERVMAEKTGETPRRTWHEPFSEDGLNLGQYEQKRKAFIEERQRDTERVMAAKTGEFPRRTWHEPSSETGLNLGQYEEKRKALVAERQRETERVMAEKGNDRRDHESYGPQKPAYKSSLPLGEYEPIKRKYQEEKYRDYNQHLAEKPPPSNRRIWREPSNNSSIGLDFKKFDWREKYQKRKNEINQRYDKEDKQLESYRSEPPSETPVYFGSREEEFERLAKTEREYRDLINQLQDRRADLPPKPATPGGFLNRLGRDGGRKEQLGDERRREYNQFMAHKSTRGGPGRRDQGEYSNTIAGLRDANSAKYRPPERPKSDSDVRGSWSQPWFERNRSYVDFKPFSLEKMKKRNEEYNEYLREKGSRRPRTEDAKQRHGEYYTTLPGLNYENPKSWLSEYERNREYNEFLRQKELREMSIRAQAQDAPPDNPRRGWATPTYEEMLQQKRQEEAKYRRYDDPEYKRPGIKSYGSEGALNGIDAQRRSKDLDHELDRRLRLDEGRRSILEDPLWLSPRRAEIYEKEYNSGPPISRLRDYNFKDAELSSPDSAKPPAEAGQEVKKQYPDPPRQAPAPRHARDPNYYATLPVGDQRERPSRSTDDGQDERMSAQQRKKEQYRRELEQQMQEAAENKRREKLEDLKVSATGAKDPQMRDERPRGFGVNAPPPPYIAPPPTHLMGPAPAAPIVAPAQAPVYKVVDPTPVYTTRVGDYDKLSPRSELVLGRKSLYAGDNQWDQIKQLDRINFDLDRSKYDIPSSNSGILERGFDSLLEPPRVPSIQPPPGLEYKPMTFITGGGVGSLSSVDDAYYLLGQKNPLEPEIVGAAQPRVQVAAPVLAAGAAAAGPSAAPVGRVRFNDEAPRRQPPGGGVTFAEDAGDKTAARAKAQAYQLELAKQIEEAKTKKARAKAEQDWYDMKLEQEAKDYNPYGKGGGGAPMKDDQGNTMADLRAMKKGYQTGAGYSAFSSSPRPPAPRDDLVKTPPSQTTALGDVTHARGGHGIFGMPKTEAEKHQSNVYKDDLQRQIEGQKAAAAREREKERYEEEKEMRRIEAERKKMQEEYEEERKKIKAKEDEARRKNEELMRQAEERKREAEQRRRDEEDERRRQQEEADRERLEQEIHESRATRTSSPPIPALSRKQASQPESAQNAPASPRVKSPPVPAARSKPVGGASSRPSSAANKPEADPQDRYVPTPQTYRLERGKSPAEPGPSTQRAPSADILNALARMKHQLASERDRVENMLDKNENEPDVFDARLTQRPPPVPRTHDIDVFERARNRSTVPVRRAPTVNEHPPNPNYLDEFNILKHGDTDSRQEFKRQYPFEPMSNDNLEQQQAALIRQQEEGLRAMRGKIKSRMSMAEEEPRAGSSRYEKALPHMDPKDLGLARHQTLSPQPMLHSNSAFIDMNGLGPVFPDDLDDLPRRNDSARQRRRDRFFSSPRPGSVTSLDVDQIARKNEQRLKKLRDMQGDDLSMNDPDDVLDRFVSKQSHHRDIEITDIDSETEAFVSPTTPYKSDFTG